MRRGRYLGGTAQRKGVWPPNDSLDIPFRPAIARVVVLLVAAGCRRGESRGCHCRRCGGWWQNQLGRMDLEWECVGWMRTLERANRAEDVVVSMRRGWKSSIARCVGWTGGGEGGRFHRPDVQNHQPRGPASGASGPPWINSRDPSSNSPFLHLIDMNVLGGLYGFLG